MTNSTSSLDKFYQHKNKEEKDFCFRLEKNKISIVAVNFLATLYAPKGINPKYKDDLINAPDAELALKWLQVINSSSKTTSLSIQERPSWCASRYKDEKEYRNVIDYDAQVIIDQRPTLIKQEGSKQYFTFSPKSKKSTLFPIYPYQTFSHKHFLTFEDWCLESNAAIDFYVKQKVKPIAPIVKINPSISKITLDDLLKGL